MSGPAPAAARAAPRAAGAERARARTALQAEVRRRGPAAAPAPPRAGGAVARRRALAVAAGAAALASLGCGYAVPAAATALLAQSERSRRGTVVLFAEGADLLLARGPADAGDTTEGRGVTFVAGQLRLTATRESTLRRLVLRGRGTLDDATLAVVRLHHDLDGDGLLEPGEPQLGSGAPQGDDGPVAFDGLALALPAGAPVDLLAVVTTPATAQEGATFRLEAVGADDVEATTVVAGETRRTPVFGAPAGTGTKTISTTGTLSVRAGPVALPAATALPNAGGLRAVQLDLRASSAEPIVVERLALRLAGTADDGRDVLRAHLWLDADSDGAVGGVDQLFAHAPAPAGDDGLLAFEGVGRTLPPGGIERWLVTLDLSGQAPDAATLQARLATAGDLSARGVTSAQPIAPQGPPLAPGPTLTVARASLTAAAGPQSGARTASPGATGVAALQVVVTAGPAEPVVVTGLGLRAAGGGDDGAHVASVRVVVDADQDGQVGAGEAVLAGPFAWGADDATTVLGGFSRELAAGASETWLVAYDLAAAAPGGATFRAELTGQLTATGRTSGLALTQGLAQVAGGTITVRGSVALLAGPSPPPAASPLANANDVPALQVRLTAGPGEAVRLTSLVVAPDGSADDAAAVQGVDLVLDQDGDGQVDGGEPVLASGTFPGDDAALVFSAPGGLLPADLAAGQSADLLVRYRLAGQGLHGQTLRARLLPGGVTASGVLSGQALPVGGAPVVGAVQTLRRARLDAALGAESPTAKALAPGATLEPVLQVRLDAGSGEPAQVTQVVVRASGTANDAAVVTGVRLYVEGAGALGALDASDALLGGPATFSGDDGQVTFTGAPLLALPAGETRRLLVVYDVAAGAPAGATLAARVDAGGVAATGASSGLPAQVVGLPVQGATHTVGAGPPAVLASQVAPVASRSVAPDVTDAAVLALRLSETTGGGAATLRQLTVRGGGTGNEATDVRFVRLWRDVAPVGSLTAADTAVALAAYFADDGAATFGGLSEAIPAGGALDLLVSYDLVGAAQAAPGETYFARVLAGDVQVETTSGAAVSVGGLPQTGGTLTVAGPELDVQAGPANPAGTLAVRAGERWRVVSQLRLAASAQAAVSVQRVDVRAQGTADDAAAVAAVALVRDQDGDGAVGEGDLELGRLASPFPADDGLAQVPVSATITAGTAQTWLVVLDLAAPPGLAAGHTLAPRVEALSLGAGQSVTGALPVAGRTLVVAGGLTVTRAPGSPGAATIAPLPSSAAPALGLRVVADAAEAVTLTGLTVTVSGSAPDATALSLRLWRDDGDGAFSSAADTALAGPVAFPADDGAVAFGGLSVAVVGSGTVDLWLTLDVAGGAPAGTTARLRVDGPGDVSVTGAVSGAVGVRGPCVAGEPQTLGHATTLFGAPASLSVGGGTALAVALGDLDRDGDLDLVVLRGDGRVEALPGNGAGGFGTAALFPTAAQPGARRLLVGDLDRDGWPDLVTVHGTRVNAYRNDGAGGFPSSPTQTIDDAGADWTSAALVDLGRDGDLDLVLGDGTGPALRLRANDGAGTFGAAVAVALTAAPVRLVAVDVDQDGIVDVVLTDAGGDVRWARGDGSTLALTDVDAVGAGLTALAAGDLDRDGHPEVLALRQAAEEVHALRGGSGGLAPSGGAQDPSPVPPLGSPPEGPRSLVPGDWDGDGRLDLAVPHAGTTDGLVVLRGDGTTVLPPARASLYAAGSDPTEGAAGDVDRDGDLDLAFAASGNVAVLRGDGRANGGTAGLAGPTRLPGDGRPLTVLLADLDVDGDLDAAAVTREGRVEVWRLADEGASHARPAPFALAGPPGGAAAGDLDRDGAPDLVVALTNPDRVDVLRGQRDGTFALATTSALLADGDPSAVALADLDRDGRLDAVVLEPATQTLQFLRGQGAGLTSAQAVDRYLVSGASVALGLGDLDRDGRPDVVVLHRAPASVEVRRGLAGLGLGAPQVTTLDAGLGTPSALALADLDRDGRLDLVVASADQASVQVLRGLGDGTFSSQGLRAAAPLRALAAVDLDRDGDLDLVGTRASPGGVVVLPCTAPGAFTFGGAQAAGTLDGLAPGALAAGDVDRDGDLDVVVAVESGRELQLLRGR